MSERAAVALGVAGLAAWWPDPGVAQAAAARDCGPKAALFSADKGIRLWVTRAGTLVRADPLRPLSRDPLIVLQVVVNGRIATAYGPDHANLRQGGDPKRLEAESEGPILWDAGAAGLPETIRIVGEDGRVLFGPLRFGECGDPPAARPAPAKRTQPAKARSADGDDRPSLSLPQGAIR